MAGGGADLLAGASLRLPLLGRGVLCLIRVCLWGQKSEQILVARSCHEKPSGENREALRNQ